MKQFRFRLGAILLLCALLAGSASATELLVPVGRAVGLALEAQGLTVAGFDQNLGENAKAAGLREGDLIVKVDGQRVENAATLQEKLARAKGGVVVTVLRDGREQTMTVEPVAVEGVSRLGIYVREGISGIGTVTYYDPSDGSFGALGHGVSDAQGNLLPLRTGRVLEAQVASVKRGRSGAPGQLVGAFRQEDQVGELFKNTPCGIFGTSPSGWPGTPLPVAEQAEIHTGSATIYSNISGQTVREYSVEILKLYPGDKAGGRNLLLRVTDPALLSATGGIVQGMSGSPILQDGRIVGAVTHVLVNDPTTGYGIFIENMLDAAS